MKRLLFAIVIFLSCERPLTDLETLIRDYEEISQGTRTDLSFRPINTTYLGPITVADSIQAIQARFSQDSLKFNLSQLEIVENRLSVMYKFFPDDLKHIEWLEAVQDTLNVILSLQRKDSVMLQHYQSIPDTLLGHHYQCTYSIINPFLNNAKQEITNVYFLSPDQTRIIHSEKPARLSGNKNASLGK